MDTMKLWGRHGDAVRQVLEWSARHDEERPEIDQADETIKRGGWQFKQLSATRTSTLVFDRATVGLRYSRYP